MNVLPRNGGPRGRTAGRRLTLLGILWIAVAQWVCAQEAELLPEGPAQEARSADAGTPDDLVTGTVLDRTITLIGHEFAQAFTMSWLDQPAMATHMLTIYERPSARWGSLIWIEWDHRSVYRAFHAPGRQNVRERAGAAAAQVGKQLEELEMQQLLFNDPDLAKDEWR